MFSTLFTLALCLTLAFSVLVIAMCLTRISVEITFNPYLAKFGRYRNQFLLGRWRVIVHR